MAESKQVEFPANVAAGRKAARTLRHYLAERGYDEATLFACELSITEACNNAVHHATDAQRAQRLSARVVCEDGHIEIAVIDHTSGFDHPGVVPPPALDAEKGRGLFLIQSFMDDVRYERGQGSNVLRMTKRGTKRERLARG